MMTSFAPKRLASIILSGEVVKTGLPVKLTTKTLERSLYHSKAMLPLGSTIASGRGILEGNGKGRFRAGEPNLPSSILQPILSATQELALP
jgi:hypothetical protein